MNHLFHLQHPSNPRLLLGCETQFWISRPPPFNNNNNGAAALGPGKLPFRFFHPSSLRIMSFSNSKSQLLGTKGKVYQCEQSGHYWRLYIIRSRSASPYRNEDSPLLNRILVYKPYYSSRTKACCPRISGRMMVPFHSPVESADPRILESLFWEVEWSANITSILFSRRTTWVASLFDPARD